MSTWTIEVAEGTEYGKKYLSCGPRGPRGEVYLDSHDEGSGGQQWVVKEVRNGNFNILVKGATDDRRKYLSGLTDASVGLHTHDDGSGIQQWVVKEVRENIFNILVKKAADDGQRYLSCTFGGYVDLFSHDDGSGRQQWKLTFQGINSANDDDAIEKKLNIERDEEMIKRASAIGPTPVADTVSGEDELGIRKDVEALAQLMALEELTPPFVLGLLGGWGSGKSFAMKLIEKSLIDIQKNYQHSSRDTYLYCGHIYVSHFRAWDYSKGDIWSSMMYQLLLDLNQQLQLEQILQSIDEDNPEYGSLLKIWDDLSLLQMEFVTKYPDFINENDLFKILNSDVASPALAAAINLNYQESKDEMDECKSVISDTRKKIADLEKELKDKRQSDEVDKKFMLKYGPKLKEMIKEHYDDWKKKMSTETTPLLLQKNNLLQKINLEESLRSTKMICQIFMHGWFSIPIIILIVISIGVTFVLTFLFNKASYWPTGLIPVFTVIARVVLKYNEIIKPVVSELEKMHEMSKESDVEAQQQAPSSTEKSQDQLSEDIENHQKKIAECEKRVDETKKRILVLEGESLKDFCSDTKISSYEQNLNVVHKAQKDIMSIAAILANKTQIEKRFPRGTPRIAIMIDDLDRCPQDKVVDTLEALQLLVSSKAFVVVIAIDMQYVTLSLENKYKGILERGKHPSGLDYVEKIIQLSYRLPPIASKALMTSYVKSLTKSSVKRTAATTASTTASSTKNSTTNEQKGTKDSIDKGNKEMADKSKKSNPTEGSSIKPKVNDVNLTAAQIDITEDEQELMATVMSQINISPRAIKRVINSFKVVKIILYRQDALLKDQSEVEKLMEACLIILGLSACLDPKVRIAMCDAHSKQEKKYVHCMPPFALNLYSVWFGDDENKMNNALNQFNSVLQKLKGIKWSGEKEWEELQQFLRLVRCFSFVGESMDDDEKAKDV